MRKLIYLLLTLWAPYLYAQTCDLALISQTPPDDITDTHTFVVDFINAETCGCNEFTQSDGNTCNTESISAVGNNENVTSLVFGIHYVDEETGMDLGENNNCTSATFHPGWSFSVAPIGNGWDSGDIATIEINTPFAWDCILANPIEGYCWEVVIWQINLSQTGGYDDFPFPEGWTSGNSFNSTQLYPDINLSDNRITVCPDPCISDTLYVDVIEYVYITDTLYIELPPDTIIQTQIDTVITQEYVYITDTLTEYVEIYVVDTIIEYIADTLEIEVIEYIFLTDTIIETIEVDCNTNLPCSELMVDECWPWSIFIPNVMTPNNDGVNDVWQIILDLECWVDVEFKIYNRWGGLVFEGYGEDYNNYPYWDGSMQGGPSYVADGMYVYTFYARKHNSPEIYQKSGHLTILR